MFKRIDHAEIVPLGFDRRVIILWYKERSEAFDILR